METTTTEDLLKEKAAIEYIADLRTSRIRESQNKAKTYFHVTAGALVLSVSFLTMSGFENITSVNMLIWSWVFLIVAIVLSLSSYVTVDLSFAKREKDTRDWIRDGMDDDKMIEDTNVWTTITRGLNVGSSLGTIVGLLALVLFGISNVNNMVNENKKLNSVEPGDSTEKHAEPSTDGPSLADRISTSTPDEKPSVPEKTED